MGLLALQDERREAKPWLPLLPMTDVSAGLVKADLAYRGKPSCIIHGAMARIDVYEQIFRCVECGVGARWMPGTTKEFERDWDRRYKEGVSK